MCSQGLGGTFQYLSFSKILHNVIIITSSKTDGGHFLIVYSTPGGNTMSAAEQTCVLISSLAR